MTNQQAIEPITRGEMIELWPKDESGALAARLAFRYLNWAMIEAAASQPTDVGNAGASAGASKVFANLVRDFNFVVHPPEKPATRQPTIRPLRRHQPVPPATPNPKPPESKT